MYIIRYTILHTFKTLKFKFAQVDTRIIDRGTQRQFSENICSEDDLRSRIFGTFIVILCLPASPRIFEHLKNGIIAHF